MDARKTCLRVGGSPFMYRCYHYVFLLVAMAYRSRLLLSEDGISGALAVTTLCGLHTTLTLDDFLVGFIFLVELV